MLAPMHGFVLYTPTTDHNRGKRDGYYDILGNGPWNGPASMANNLSKNLSSLVMRWHHGEQDDWPLRGLGGGISWALHPRFCEQMLSQFRSEQILFGSSSLIDCSQLRAAIAVGFHTWSANHRLISFHDVSASCSDEDALTHGGTRCSEAEVLILSNDQPSEGMEGTVAYVSFHMDVIERSPRMTNDDVLPDGFGILGATISVNPSHCWYLDATFCSMIHSFVDKNGLEAAVRTTMVLLIALSALLFVWLIRRSNAIARHESSPFLCIRRRRRASVDTSSTELNSIDEEGATSDDSKHRLSLRSCVTCDRSASSKRNTRKLAHEMGRTIIHLPLCPTLILTFCAVFLPTFYFDVFLPCYECHDFEATIAHEAGHLLGFHHPDSYPARNLVSSAGFDAGRGCDDPLFLNYERGEFLKGSDTLMMSQAAHRPRTCLTQDDYDGLHALYPLCPPRVNQVPSCSKLIRYTGVVRLVVSVAIPFMTATIVLLLTQTIARYIQRERVRLLEDKVHRQSMQQTWLRASLVAASQAKAKAEAKMARLTRPSFRPSFRPSLRRSRRPPANRADRAPPRGIFATPRMLNGLTGMLTWRKGANADGNGANGHRSSGQRASDHASPLDILEQHLQETRAKQPRDPLAPKPHSGNSNKSLRHSKETDQTNGTSIRASANAKDPLDQNAQSKRSSRSTLTNFWRQLSTPRHSKSKPSVDLKEPHRSMSPRTQASAHPLNGKVDDTHPKVQMWSEKRASTKSMDSTRSSAGSSVLNRSRGTRDTLVLGADDENYTPETKSNERIAV